MIGHKYVPSREGGVEIVVEELATRLAKKGHGVTLFNRKRKQYAPISEYKGVKIENIFSINKRSLDAFVYAFFATLKVRKMIKKKQVDIIHYHAEGPCFFLNLLPKREKRPGTKIVVTIHGLDWKRNKWGKLAGRVILKAERRLVKYADEVIVLSKNTKRYFGTEYHRTVKYIPNGINVPTLREANLIKEKYGLVRDSYILFLARIVPEKGLDYLIDAWRLVKQQIKTDKKLVIAGGSSHSDEYYDSIVNKVQGDDSIVMTGFIEGQELEELFSNAYLYVLPSDIEGMPISLLEALSYGNICLVSNIPENTEVINENCFVFEASNVDCLRHQIKKIINLNLVTHEQTYTPYSWDDVVNKTIEIYQR